MNIPVYYKCKRCFGQFPYKDYVAEEELCKDCWEREPRLERMCDGQVRMSANGHTITMSIEDWIWQITNCGC